MEKKTFKGKAIYNPSGKAGEYSYWACNFYNGCSNGCKYCYCKKGLLKKTMGGDVPTLKKSFQDEEHAIEVFEKELLQNISELQKCGLFFSFTTDPMLDETMDLTLFAMQKCLDNGVNVKVLTKNAENPLFALVGCSGLSTIGGVMQNYFTEHRKMIAIGFTLTGHDELEKGASTNQERIEAIKILHNAGFKTFASIEPIIDFESSMEMILSISAADGICCCDLLKIGLESGKKYNKEDLQLFVNNVIGFSNSKTKIYFKDTLLSQAGINRSDLPKYCVGRDYNLFVNYKNK